MSSKQKQELARSGRAPRGSGLGGRSVGWGVLRAPWPPRVLRLPCSPVGSVSPTGTEASSSPKTPSTPYEHVGLTDLLYMGRSSESKPWARRRDEHWVLDLSAPLLRPFPITTGSFLLPLKSLFLPSQHALLAWFSRFAFLLPSRPPSFLPLFSCPFGCLPARPQALHSGFLLLILARNVRQKTKKVPLETGGARTAEVENAPAP